MSAFPNIGILALQGCVSPHRPHIEAAGGVFLPVKTAADLEKIDALILPGGESTTMLKLINAFGLKDPLMKAFAQKPVWGICAGAILMADKVQSPEQESFCLLPMTVTRNAYGRQLDSVHMEVGGYPVSFIRAPVIDDVRGDVEILAARAGRPVWVRSGNYMASTFHPELTLRFPSPMHRTFIEMVTASRRQEAVA